MDQDEPREMAKMSTKSLMAGGHWEIFLLLRKHYDSLKQNLKSQWTAFCPSLCNCFHFFKLILVLVRMHAYFRLFNSKVYIKFYTQILLHYFMQIHLFYHIVFIFTKLLKYSLSLVI